MVFWSITVLCVGGIACGFIAGVIVAIAIDRPRTPEALKSLRFVLGWFTTINTGGAAVLIWQANLQWEQAAAFYLPALIVFLLIAVPVWYDRPRPHTKPQPGWQATLDRLPLSQERPSQRTVEPSSEPLTKAQVESATRVPDQLKKPLVQPDKEN